MNIGDKIKLVRRHRGLTQQQLGILIDIKNGAANRIAQYETGYRTPKAEIVEKIAKVLNVREETFYMPNDTIVDLIRTLIWYDWEHSLPFQDFGDSTQCFLLRIRLSCSHPAVKALLADWQIHKPRIVRGCPGRIRQCWGFFRYPLGYAPHTKWFEVFIADNGAAILPN